MVFFHREKFDMQYAKTKKWYLPASGIPWFDVEIYKGSVRRVQYTMNNTKGDAGYQPPPCFVDWPADTYAMPTPAVKWTIQHCLNIVSSCQLYLKSHRYCEDLCTILTFLISQRT